MSVRSGLLTILALALAWSLLWPASLSRSSVTPIATATISPADLKIDVNLPSESWDAE